MYGRFEWPFKRKEDVGRIKSSEKENFFHKIRELFLRVNSKGEKESGKMILDELDTQHKNITVNSSFFLSFSRLFFFRYIILTHHVRKIFVRNAIAEKLHSDNCSSQSLAAYFIAARCPRRLKKCI